MSAQILPLRQRQPAGARPAADTETALLQACRRLLESFDALGERAGSFQGAVGRLQDQSRGFMAAQDSIASACAPLRTLAAASATRFD
jgi:hypothetical protein